MFRLLMLVAAGAFGWTVFDAVRTGWIRTGRGVWHRNVNRDDNPGEFWLAVLGNSIGCVVVLGILIASLVYPSMSPQR